MPTEAFNQLDESKKQHLLNSAVCEFSEHPYEKVSVFKIAQNAEMSRTGFYYYFKDKEDIYQYLLLQINKKFIETLEAAEEYDDIFKLTKAIFRELAKIKGTDGEQFIYRVIENMRSDDAFDFLHQMETCKASSAVRFFEGAEKLGLQRESQQLGLAALMITSTLCPLRGYIRGTCSLQEAEQQMNEMIHMIQFGVRNDKEDAGEKC